MIEDFEKNMKNFTPIVLHDAIWAKLRVNQSCENIFVRKNTINHQIS